MKVIHLILGKANPERMNGVNKLVHEMVSTQHKIGFNVQLWGITKSLKHDYPDRFYTTRLFQMLPNKFRIHATIKEAIKGLSKDTVFHFHGSFIPEFYHVSKILKDQGIPYVYTPHGALAPAALRRKSWKKKIYFKLFEKSLIKHASGLIATGQSVFDNVDALVTTNRKALIPNGQPLIEYDFPKKKNDKIVFGYCGRIALEHKGLDLLLEGFKKYLDQGGNAELHLIGDGAEMKDFKIIAECLDVLDKITLYGAKFGEEKLSLLSGFDVFVHTSRMEGFPAAVLEASAMGIPVMISRHTNVWDYISKHECGLLVDPNTPENIAKQMLAFEKLYASNALNEMSENAKQMIESVFDWEAICLSLYREYLLALADQQKYKVKALKAMS